MNKAYFLFTIVAILVISSCTKYEEGPLLTLRTNKQRLSRTWRIDQVISSNGSTSNGDQNYKITFDKEGTFDTQTTVLGASITSQGDWEFVGDTDINLTTVGTFSVTSRYTIVRLTAKEFWLRDSGNNETHYIPAD